jgi:hypothetical protein
LASGHPGLGWKPWKKPTKNAGFHGDFMGFYGDFMWISWDFMGLVRKGTIVKMEIHALKHL